MITVNLAEHLRAAAANMNEHNWTQCSFFRPDNGTMCAFTHMFCNIGYSTDVYVTDQRLPFECMHMMEAVDDACRDLTGVSLINFNDVEATCAEDVIRMMRQCADKLEEWNRHIYEYSSPDDMIYTTGRKSPYEFYIEGDVRACLHRYMVANREKLKLVELCCRSVRNRQETNQSVSADTLLTVA